MMGRWSTGPESPKHGGATTGPSRHHPVMFLHHHQSCRRSAMRLALQIRGVPAALQKYALALLKRQQCPGSLAFT